LAAHKKKKSSKYGHSASTIVAHFWDPIPSNKMPASIHITKVETLKCGAGFRDFCFVKISTDGLNSEVCLIFGP
jgi:hypothetical protein